MPGRIAFALAARAALAGATGVIAGAAPAQQSSPPIFEAEASLVAAPVFVTDGSGRAVAGLTAADFEVNDGGKAVPIVAFRAVDVDAPASLSAATAPAVLEAVRAAAARQFLFLFDLQFSPPGGVLRAREAAARFIRESLAETDLVAVATFGRRGLSMLTGFTTDRAYIARAIEGLGVVAAIEPASDPLGLNAVEEMSADTGGVGRAAIADQEIAAQIGVMQEALRLGYQQRVLDLYTSLERLAGALAPLRGRKQVVFLSGGQAQEAWTESSAFATVAQLRAQSLRDQTMAYALRDRMQQIFERAGVSDVLIRTVNLHGTETGVDLASRTARSLGRGEGDESLAALAKNTGGLRVRATNDFGAALREVEAASRHYYVLAFQPADPPPAPGRRRDVKVRVKRDGLHVSHRAAYEVPKPSPKLDPSAARLAASETIAKGLTGGPVGLEAVALPYRDADGNAKLPVVLHVDGAALASVAREGKVPLQVYGYALAAGSVLDSGALDTTLEPSKGAAIVPGEGLRVLTAFDVTPGPVEIRFFVRLGTGGQTGALRRQLDVPAFAASDAVVSPALVAREVTGKLVVRMDTGSPTPFEIPFRLGSVPFLPEARPVLEPGRATELAVFVWPSHGSSPFEVTAELWRAGEPPQPIALNGTPRVVPDRDGFDRYLVVVVPPQAQGGDYLLRLTFRDPATGRTVVSETKVTLRPGSGAPREGTA